MNFYFCKSQKVGLKEYEVGSQSIKPSIHPRIRPPSLANSAIVLSVIMLPAFVPQVCLIYGRFYTGIVRGTLFDLVGSAEKCCTFISFGFLSCCTLFMRTKLPGQHHAVTTYAHFSGGTDQNNH